MNPTAGKSLVLFKKGDKPYVIMTKNLDADTLLLLDETIEASDLDRDELEIIESDVACEIVHMIKTQRKYVECLFAQYSSISDNIVELYIVMAAETDAQGELFLKYKTLVDSYISAIEFIKAKLEEPATLKVTEDTQAFIRNIKDLFNDN